MRCQSCGAGNSDDARYCGRCGSDLKAARHEARAHRSERSVRPRRRRLFGFLGRWQPATVAITLIAGCAIVVFVLSMLRNSVVPTSAVPLAEKKSSNPQVEKRVTAIASKFICSCGSCGEQPLDTCTCGTAVQERQYIRDAIESGQNDGEIVAAVRSTYGWMKTDSADLAKNPISPGRPINQR